MKDSEQRKNWYSEVADAYNRVRPRYPKELICRAVELAQLPSGAAILEIGCGPGTATVEFASVGFSMVCLEPSQEACQLARFNCAQYPNVEIINITFEDWGLVSEQLVCEVTYSINDYLALLSTLSPYIRLDPQKRNSLFEGLRETLERNCTSIQTSYLSAFHIAQKYSPPEF